MEAAQITDYLYRQSMTPPAPPPAQPQAPSADEWLTDGNQAARKWADAYLNPQLQSYAQAIGQTSRELVKSTEKDAFTKWGTEIDTLINQVDPQMRTVDNISRIVRMVKADHLDELAEERATARIQQMQAAGGLRADTAGGAPGSASPAAGVDFSQLPEKYRRTLEKYHTTSRELDEFLLATDVKTKGLTLEQARADWLAKATVGDIVVESAIRL
jgi:hypothetical protein